jgi:uncharacterized protein HemX
MALIADALLAAAALGAGFYCFVLSRRLRRFTDLEKGMGGAVAVLSVQVEDMKSALEQAQKTAGCSADQLEEATRRAERVARQLELSMASAHGVRDPGDAALADATRTVRRRRRDAPSGTREEAPA